MFLIDFLIDYRAPVLLPCRCAKHDTTGAMPWAEHRAVIAAHCMWAFEISVGPANAVPPYGALCSGASLIVLWWWWCIHTPPIIIT